MFGIGPWELILILFIALVVFGPKKLPDLAKSLGQAINEFKKATQEFKDTINTDSGNTGAKKSTDDMPGTGNQWTPPSLENETKNTRNHMYSTSSPVTPPQPEPEPAEKQVRHSSNQILYKQFSLDEKGKSETLEQNRDK